MTQQHKLNQNHNQRSMSSRLSQHIPAAQCRTRFHQPWYNTDSPNCHYRKYSPHKRRHCIRRWSTRHSGRCQWYRHYCMLRSCWDLSTDQNNHLSRILGQVGSNHSGCWWQYRIPRGQFRSRLSKRRGRQVFGNQVVGPGIQYRFLGKQKSLGCTCMLRIRCCSQGKFRRKYLTNCVGCLKAEELKFILP
jgi:hypothetical protein